MKLSDYYVDGVAKDQEWIIKNHEYLEEELHNYMRQNGYIPVLDQPMKVTWEFDAETGNFKYRLAAKGQGVGRKKSQKYLGILSEERILLDINVEEASLI